MAKDYKTISLRGDHVFMPANPLDPEWRSNGDTLCYAQERDDKLLKYKVHPGLADFLIKRKQALEVPDEG